MHASGENPILDLMSQVTTQLGLFEEVTVRLRWHRKMAPPDATCPFHHGTYEAVVDGLPAASGWAGSERRAIEDLARSLHDRPPEGRAGNELTGAGQVGAAARRLEPEELALWLAERVEGYPLAVDIEA